jgi:hypothetical protein
MLPTVVLDESSMYRDSEGIRTLVAEDQFLKPTPSSTRPRYLFDGAEAVVASKKQWRWIRLATNQKREMLNCKLLLQSSPSCCRRVENLKER